MEPVGRNITQKVNAMPLGDISSSTTSSDPSGAEYSIPEFICDVAYGVFQFSIALLKPIANLASSTSVEININYFSRLNYLDPSVPASARMILDVPEWNAHNIGMINTKYRITIEALETMKTCSSKQKDEDIQTLIAKTHAAYQTLIAQDSFVRLNSHENYNGLKNVTFLPN